MKTVFIALLLFCASVLPASAQTLIPEVGQPEIAPGCGDLGAKFQTGNFEIADIPCYATYLTQTIIYLAGVLAVLFVVVGGYQYVSAGAMEENRESAKKTITYALVGLAVTVLAWTVVNVWQVFITGG